MKMKLYYDTTKHFAGYEMKHHDNTKMIFFMQNDLEIRPRHQKFIYLGYKFLMPSNICIMFSLKAGLCQHGLTLLGNDILHHDIKNSVCVFVQNTSVNILKLHKGEEVVHGALIKKKQFEFTHVSKRPVYEKTKEQVEGEKQEPKKVIVEVKKRPKLKSIEVKQKETTSI